MVQKIKRIAARKTSAATLRASLAMICFRKCVRYRGGSCFGQLGDESGPFAVKSPEACRIDYSCLYVSQNSGNFMQFPADLSEICNVLTAPLSSLWPGRSVYAYAVAGLLNLCDLAMRLLCAIPHDPLHVSHSLAFSWIAPPNLSRSKISQRPTIPILLRLLVSFLLGRTTELFQAWESSIFHQITTKTFVS